MILEVDENYIPHYQNIIDIHETHSVLRHILPSKPFIAGGYPTALLFAPRAKSSNMKIIPGYYSDYDLYFSSEKNYKLARKILIDDEAGGTISKVHSTENADTIEYVQLDPIIVNLSKCKRQKLQIQLIKKVIQPPEKILESFDFINCAAGYYPATKSFFLHKDIFHHHLKKELEILKPWMLDDVNESTLSNVVIQIARFKKYCLRWNYALGPKAYEKLLEVYLEYPNIKTKKDQFYSSTAGYDKGIKYIARKDQNIWTALLSLFEANPNWEQFIDPHEILKESPKLITKKRITDRWRKEIRQRTSSDIQTFLQEFRSSYDFKDEEDEILF